MDKWHIFPSSLSGNISIPPSKSQSMRALTFAFMARGKSRITNILQSPDIEAMIRAGILLGCKFCYKGDVLEIEGVNGKINCAEDIIDAQNSGLILRFIGSIASHSSHPIIITGDESVRHRRPVTPLLNALSQLGVKAVSTRGDGGAPIIVQGPIKPGTLSMCGKDSQPVSGILIASAFSLGAIEIFVTDPGEKPWVDMTLNWFDRLGIEYSRKGYEWYRVNGNASYPGFTYRVPSDLSSLAFPLAAALVTRSNIRVTDVELDELQGDKKIIEIFQKMGGEIDVDRERKVIFAKGPRHLKGIFVDVNDCIDALPILAVVGCFAKEKTQIVGGGIARKKESDRIRSIYLELKKMGAKIEEHVEGLTIYPSNLNGAVLQSHDDHRIAMSLAVAALGSDGKSVIQGIGCVSKSFPNFPIHLQKIGARIT